MRSFFNKVDWPSKVVELLVVILGVSIAFALNNWRESSKSRDREYSFCESLIAELEKDEKELLLLIDTTSYYISLNDQFVDLLSKDKISEDTASFLLFRLYIFYEFPGSTTTYETLKASGNMSIISNFDLRKKITALYTVDYEAVEFIDEIHRSEQYERIAPYVYKYIDMSDGFSLVEGSFLKKVEFKNTVYTSQYFLTNKKMVYENTYINVSALLAALKDHVQRL